MATSRSAFTQTNSVKPALPVLPNEPPLLAEASSLQPRRHEATRQGYNPNHILTRFSEHS